MATRDLVIGWLGDRLDGRSDEQIERWFGPFPVQWALFRAAARSYVPSVALGFRGTLVYELTRPASGRDSRSWSLDVFDSAAVASTGAPVGGVAAVSLRLPLSDFVRSAVGLIDPAEPLLAGRALVTGDLALASLLPEMFGSARPR